MRLPPDARDAMVDLLGAAHRYGEHLDALALLNVDADTLAFDKTAMILMDAEQAIVRLLEACFGKATVEGDDDDAD